MHCGVFRGRVEWRECSCFSFFFELFMYFARCVLLLAVVVNWLLTVYGNCGVSVPRCDSNFTSSANIRSQSHIVMASSKVSFFLFCFSLRSSFAIYAKTRERTHFAGRCSPVRRAARRKGHWLRGVLAAILRAWGLPSRAGEESLILKKSRAKGKACRRSVRLP